MVIRLSGVLFGLWSYEWLENRTTTKQESVCLSRNSPVWLGKIIVATVIIINSSFGGSSWFWLQSVLTLVMVYLPAADMSLANSKSPTLATKLASTKIFLAAKSRWTNCERRQCIIFLLRHAQWLSGLCKGAKDPQCVLKLIYELGLHAFLDILLDRGSRGIEWPIPKCKRSAVHNLELPALYLVQQEIINCL